MAVHDHGYKQLFSHPEMVRDLLLGFVPFDWVQDLDFTTLEKLNNSYITDDLRERADDLVWRVKFRGQWLYLYLLLEFQSTVDRFMAVRLLTYVGLLYQDLIKSKQLSGKSKLPPVMPLVLYNGVRPCKAAVSLTDLIQPMPEQLQAFQPALQYLLIDERSFDAAELERLQNLTAALIRAELADGPEAMARVVANLIVWLDQDRQADLVRAFNEWIGRILIRNKVEGVELESIRNLTEMHSMLNERSSNWGRAYIEQGLKQGLEQGREQGIELGEARTLKRQLTRRFGALPQWAMERIDHAKGEQLEQWLDLVLDADSLEQVFD